jgi:hypothetical protein
VVVHPDCADAEATSAAATAAARSHATPDAPALAAAAAAISLHASIGNARAERAGLPEVSDRKLNCRFVFFGFVCLSCVLWICVDEVFIGLVRGSFGKLDGLVNFGDLPLPNLTRKSSFLFDWCRSGYEIDST